MKEPVLLLMEVYSANRLANSTGYMNVASLLVFAMHNAEYKGVVTLKELSLISDL